MAQTQTDIKAGDRFHGQTDFTWRDADGVKHRHVIRYAAVVTAAGTQSFTYRVTEVLSEDDRPTTFKARRFGVGAVGTKSRTVTSEMEWVR